MFLTLFAEDFLWWYFIFIFVFFFLRAFFFRKEMGIANTFYSSVYTVSNLAILVEATEQDVNFIIFVILFFFLTLSTINRVFFFLLFQFLIPVYNVKLFLQLVIVIIFKYFFSSLKITKQDRKLKRWSLLLHILHLDFFILLPTVFYGGYYYRDADDDRYIHIQNKYILK